MIIKNIFNRYLVLALTLVFTSAAVWAEKVISVDITTSSVISTDQTTLVGTIPADAWAKGTAVTQNNLATIEYDTVAASSSSLNETKVSWSLSSVPTGLCYVETPVDASCNYFKSGLCRGNRGQTDFTFTMTNIPYKNYKVYLYFTYDHRNNTTAAPFPGVRVNGTEYTVTNGAIDEDSRANWGTRLEEFSAPELLVNAMCIEGQTSETLTIEGTATCGAVAAVQVVKAVDVGDEVVWSNTGTTGTVSEEVFRSCQYGVLLPAIKGLPVGSTVKIKSVKLASWNTTYNDWNTSTYKSDAYTIVLNGVTSNPVNGATAANAVNMSETIAISATETAPSLTYTFSNECIMTVGEEYIAPSGTNKSTSGQGMTMVHNNNNTNAQGGIGVCSFRHVTTDGNDAILNSAATSGYAPVYEITAEVVSIATAEPEALIEVNFTKANNEDWEELILPTNAKGVEVTGNLSFANRKAYKQTLGDREATVALVTDAQAGNLIYGLHAFNGGAGLGAIDRDIYLMVTGGTPGVISGGEDANWSGTKTIPTGNLLVNIKGDTTVDYVYGAGLGGGTQNPLAKIDGNIGIVVEENAQVKGSLVGGWQSRHNAIPEVTGNVSILIKNIQTHEGDATIQNDKHCVQGFIAGGGVFNTNNGRSLVRGNTSVAIDLPNDAEGSFMKHIVAGGLGVGGGDGNNVEGSSSVVISALDTVIFPKNIMGGGHSTVTNKAKVGGNSSVTINGGTFTGTIYAAGDNGENTLVAGTATLTVNDGDLMGATILPGTATGEKILNLNGGKLPLNTISGFTTINIGNDAEICFNDGAVAGTVYPLMGCSMLTYNGQTSGTVELPAADILVGSVTMNAAVTLDLDKKEVMYSISSDSTLTRRADFDGMTEEDYEWNASGSWINGNGDSVDWPEGGASYVVINADEVSKIVVDGKIKADMITVSNTAEVEGAEFRFETKEDLDKVGDTSIADPDFIITGKVSAADFAGKLYLQARISDAIALGDETRVIFVAGIDENKSDEENAAEETTAYPYTFSNLQHPIGKVGLGTFIVPSSMYTYAFNIDNGTISYNTPGEVNGVVTCQNEGIGQIAVNAGEGNSVTISVDNSGFTGSVLVRSGTLKMGHDKCLGEYGINRTIRVKTGAVLDMNGRSNGYRESTTYCLTLEEGATYKNSAAHHSDIKAAFPISKLVLEGDATMNCDGFACGLARHYNNSTAIELGEHTLEIIGTQPAYMSCPQVTGTGKILVTSGGLRLAHNSGAQPQIANGTLDIASGTVLTLETYTAGTKPVVKNLVLNGTVNCLSENCSITVNGLLSGVGSVGGDADGVGKLILGPEAKYDGSSLTPKILNSAEVGQPLPLITAKTSITFGTGFAAVNLPTGWEIYHTDTEIGIINTANGLILNSETLDLTDGHFQEIPLGPTHNDAKIKITRPAKFIKIAAVVEGVTSIPTGLTIIDENEEDITADCVAHDGVIYFGKLHSETEYTFTSEQLESFVSGATGIMQDIDPMTVIAPTELTFTNLPENALAKIIDNRLLLIKKTNSISIKFGPRGATEGHIGEFDENVGGFPVMGMFWNHSKDYNDNNNSTTEIFKVKDGNGNVLPNTRVFYSCPNTYFVNSGNNHQTTGNGKLTYSYFDDQNRAEFNDTNKVITGEVDGNAETYNLTATPAGRLHWEVGVENVPYQMFDLYIYQASDLTGDSISLLPIAVKANNGEWKYFAGDGNGSTIGGDASSRWNGAPYCDSETMVEGLNYIRYRMSAAALGLASGETINTIYLSHPAVSNGRLGLAGIQLVAVDNDGLYTRQADPADMGGDDDERNAWTREDSWKKSDGTTINWPTSGERNVTINADQVKAIRLNTAITATKVNLVNSATTYTQGQKIFKFLTLEDLDDVATPKDNPEYILDAPVDATGFCGDLYLQSRISGMVSLGANTHITFVAMEEGKETTAYPYSFAGTRNAIRKIGPGTFRVPGSMYNMGFNIAEGYLRFNDNGTYTGTITGNNPVIVTASDFKMSSASQFNGASEVVVKEGASFDQNGLTGGSTTVLTLDGGSFVNNKAVNGLDATYSNHAYPIKTLNVTKDSTIGGTQHFGFVGGQWSAVTMNMSNDVTLSKTGTNVFAVVNLTINGKGTIDVQGGTFATRHSAVSATDATIIVHDGATLDVGSDLSVGTLAGDGTLVGSGRLSVKAIDTTKGSDIITIPEGFNIDLPDILTAVVNDDSAPILNGITEGIKLPTYIQIKANGQPMKYHPVVRDGMLYAEKINVEGILIPTIEHTTVTVKADGQLVEPDSDNMISVMEGTKLEVTYTAEEGYYIKNGTISFVVLSSKDNTIDISKVIVSDQPLTIIPIVLIETKGTKLWIKDGIVDEDGLAIEGDTLIVHAERRAGYSSLALTVNNDTYDTPEESVDVKITVQAPATFIKTTCTKNN